MRKCAPGLFVALGSAGLRAGVFVAHGAVPDVRALHGWQRARVSGRDVLPDGPRKASYLRLLR